MMLITIRIDAIIAQQGFSISANSALISYVVDMVGILVLRKFNDLCVAMNAFRDDGDG